jgi:acetate kinase
MGLSLDSAANNSASNQSSTIISTADSAIAARVVVTEEDAQIARHSRALLVAP